MRRPSPDDIQTHDDIRTLRRLDWLERQVATLRSAVITELDASRDDEHRRAAERLARLQALEESLAAIDRREGRLAADDPR